MRNYICLKRISFIETENLSFTDYSIIYQDDKDGMYKVAIPDYDNKYIDENNIDEALNTSKIGFFQNIKYTDRLYIPFVFMVKTNDGVIEKIYDLTVQNQDISNMLNYSGKILSKRLK